MARRPASIARSASLIALAALAVHQLRYLLAYGSGAHEQLARQGHGYLLEALPILAGFAIATLAGGLLRVALSAAPAPSIGSPRTRAIIYAATVLSVFVVQETAEGLLGAGHASGLGAVFAGGGWLALPLSLLFGSICAALDGGLARVEGLVAAPGTSLPSRRPRCRVTAGRTWLRIAAASRPLEFGLARRPPPQPS